MRTVIIDEVLVSGIVTAYVSDVMNVPSDVTGDGVVCVISVAVGVAPHAAPLSTFTIGALLAVAPPMRTCTCVVPAVSWRRRIAVPYHALPPNTARPTG